MNPFISLSIMSLSKCVSHPTLWSYSIKRRSIIDGKETRAEMKAGYERWLASSGISTSCIPSPTYAAIPIARYCDGSIYNVNISYELNVKLVRKVQNVCFLKKNFQRERKQKQHSSSRIKGSKEFSDFIRYHLFMGRTNP
jgi:hypothetical protein